MALYWTGRMSGTGRLPVQHDFIEFCGLHLSFREDARLSSGNFRYCRQRVEKPHFRRNEKILAWDSTFCDGFTHLRFVEVTLCSIYQSITCLYGIQHTSCTFLFGYLIDSIAQFRHTDSVVQYYILHNSQFCCLYSLGVIPVTRLNTRLKWLGYL